MHKAAKKALSLVGQGYIYGAKGQTCSPAFRRQQAAQYPDQAEHILGTGAKWDGAAVWDCAQLTRAAAKAAGVALVSGATSQWNKTEWARKGSMETLPEGETALVYRRQTGSGTVMQHTGVALGDGTCVHARGTAYGVVRQRMDEYPWTHWGVPVWPKEKEETPMENTATVKAPSGTVNLRTGPNKSADLVDRLAIGTEVEVLDEQTGSDGERWMRIRHNGRDGYMMSQYLQREDASEPPQESGAVGLCLPRETAEALLEALQKAVNG